jgi:hypothetical protein
MAKSPLRTSLLGFIIAGVIAALLPGQASAESKPFNVVVQREKTADGLIVGKLLVNGEEISTCYENPKKKLPAGTYKGVLRTKSNKKFVQGPGGKLGKTGDFLLEVAGVPKRSDILFHAGNKPEHSEGCILCGPATKDKHGDPVAPKALKKLRLLFYDGADMPTGTPDKAIKIEVRDP